MKRTGGLWEELVSFGNLLDAARKAQKGKREKNAVLLFNRDLESNLIELQEELKTGDYRPGGYKAFWVQESKRRLISAAPYRDRIVHHAVCNLIEPFIERSFIHDSYACRKGKGQHRAADRAQSFCRKRKYALKCDIRKFFPSIDHEILKGLLRHKLKDEKILGLCDMIIDGSNLQEEAVKYFPGDNLFTPYERRRGLPIGNLTSQFFANIYLDPLDHFVKERLRVKGYVRYADDFLLFDDTPKTLLKWRDAMRDFLASLRLIFHPGKCHVWNVLGGLDFVGYRIFPFHRRLRRGSESRQRRRMEEQMAGFREGTVTLEEIKISVQSWVAHASHADTYGLRKHVLGPL